MASFCGQGLAAWRYTKPVLVAEINSWLTSCRLRSRASGMSDRVIECASRAGRDFSEFMKGEKGMMEALASVDEFGEQLRLNGCVNHHFVSYMMRNSIMQAFMDMAKAERKEERRRKRAESKAK